MRSLDLVSPLDYPIRCAYVPGQRDDPDLHRHANVELVVVSAGSGLHDTGAGQYQLQRGDVFVIPIGMPHRYCDTKALHLWNIGYDPQRIDLPHARLARLPGYRVLVEWEPRLRDHQAFAGHLRLENEALDWLHGTIADLDRELQAQAAGWQEAASACFQGLLLRLARAYAAQDTPSSQAALRLTPVMAYIHAHLARDLSQARLATVGQMSISTMQRTFRLLTGHSATQYVIERRIEVACRLLTEGLAVNQVAQRVGIDDPSYFARLFRRRRGCSPITYQEQGNEN